MRQAEDIQGLCRVGDAIRWSRPVQKNFWEISWSVLVKLRCLDHVCGVRGGAGRARKSKGDIFVGDWTWAENFSSRREQQLSACANRAGYAWKSMGCLYRLRNRKRPNRTSQAYLRGAFRKNKTCKSLGKFREIWVRTSSEHESRPWNHGESARPLPR